MASVSAASTPFADWLRAELAQRGWGLRTLARKIDPERPEVPRRALYHYLRGSLPTETYAAAIAAAFGIAREDVPVEEAAPSGDPFRGRDGGSVAPRRDRSAARDGAGVKDAA